MFFNVQRLIDDLGGPAAVASALGIARTIPYRWKRSGTLGLDKLCLIKQHWPGVRLDTYFEETACKPSSRAKKRSNRRSSAT